MKKISNTLKLSVLLAASVFILANCNTSPKEEGGDATDTTLVTETTASATDQQKLTDPEIASIAVTANQIDIDYARIALEKSSNADVKKFATTMAKDHQAVIDQAIALATKLGVTPQDNATTQSLVKGAADIKAVFDTKSGADFDKAYVDNEVEYHKAAISLVESKLIADATNAELKSLLQSALPIFKGHLEHAEMVQKGLAK